jgi:pyruvate/2-oxoglutarate dehydrogenase complex dihydrolipoamide dehydrogenase (E3) component
MANYHAGIVIRRALFRMPAKMDINKIPWVTYTDPELAHIGLTEEQASKKHGKVHVLRWPYAENDRAQAERKTDGLIKLVTTRKGKILGVSIVGENAGEIIQMWSLAMSSNLNIKAFTGFVSPYPTLSEINKRVAYTYFQPKLMSPLLRKAIKFLAKFG